MIQRIEDITVISTDEFLSYEGDMIFVDTDLPFKSTPIAQVYMAIGDAEETLPTMWQECSIFGGDIFFTVEEKVLHTFLSLELQEQVDPGKFIFIKVIAIGEPDTTKPIRLS